jgi:hypothetical protein
MNPDPRSIAHALSEAVAPRVVAADRYQADWRRMAVAGVPPRELRHALDRKLVDTQPLRELRAWDGEGLLALVGVLESGKSHAAALWLLDGVRRQRRCAWVSSSALLSWTDVEVSLGRGQRAERFVFDDVGVGTISQTDDFAAKIEAVLHARHSAGLPTIITSNANQAHFEQTIGPRVMSRLKTGGKIADIVEALDLRGAESDLPSRTCPCGGAPECGHGSRWRRAHRLIKIFGLEIDDRYDEKTGRVVKVDRVGDALDSSLARRADPLRFLRELADELRVPWRHGDPTPPNNPPAPGLLERAAAHSVAMEELSAQFAEVRNNLHSTVRRGIAPTRLSVPEGMPEADAAALVAFGLGVRQVSDGYVVTQNKRFASSSLPTKQDALDFARDLARAGW